MALTHLLTQAIEQLSLAEDLTSVTAIVASTARKLFNAQGATFVLREDDKCFYANENSISPLWKGRRFPMMACISGWSMIHKEIVIIPDIYLDNRIPHDAYRPTFVKSLCMVPIRSVDPIGAIGVYWSIEHIPNPDQIKLLQILANNTVVALENIELKNTVHRRRKEKQALLAKNGELEFLMQSLVHDLKNPLTAIFCLSGVLRRQVGTQLGEKNGALINTILKTGHRLNCQLDKMLALFRMENGSLAITPVDLSSMVKEIAEDIKAGYPQREFKFHIEDNLEIMADRDLIRIVLDNFFSNAVKYSFKKPFSEISFGQTHNLNGKRVYFLKDNGAGFLQEDQHKLFQALSRLHTAQEFSGNGIGLASVAKIIKMHGGRVWAKGKLGEGATFFFTIPKMRKIATIKQSKKLALTTS
jgi:K+-sensing histidine kinase KdpD